MVDSPRYNGAIITGGSSGLGLSLARRLLARGTRVALLARNAERLAKARTVLGGSEGIILVPCDVSSKTEVDIALSQVEREFPYDLVVCAAGAARFEPVGSMTTSGVTETLGANLLGVVYTANAAIPRLRERPRGAFVAVLSTAATVAREAEPAYCAAKWGARGFLEALRAACKGSQVDVMGVFPGGMDTPFWDRAGHPTAQRGKFMSPDGVAGSIEAALWGEPGCQVSELVITRPS